MSVTVQLAVDGTAVPDAFYDAVKQLEVEESSDQPGALILKLPVNRTTDGDLQYVGDGSFEPMSNVTVLVTPGASGSTPQCVFDGYVLSWRLHLDRTITNSTTEIWCQDASWLMNQDDNVVEWSGQTDGAVANAIFSNYGFTPADANTDDDSPAHTDDGHTLFQRATDLQFLRGLARRGGKLCRVACTDTPGDRTGYFVAPSVDGQPVATIDLTDPAKWTVDTLDFDWDVMRPTEADASQVDLTQASDSGTDVSTDSCGQTAMDERDYPTYFGSSSTLLLTVPADVPELTYRTTGVLVESGLFARCTAQLDSERLGTVLRVGDVVTIAGAGSLHSGNWLVWNVRHTYSPQAWKMNVTLVRNAMGPAGTSSALAALAAAAGTGGLSL